MKGLSKESATWLEVGEEGDAQRVDNYLTRLLKGVPKSHIYRILRSGEVRVNGGRGPREPGLKGGARLRLPPVRTAERAKSERNIENVAPCLDRHILHEDEALAVINKPAGM